MRQKCKINASCGADLQCKCGVEYVYLDVATCAQVFVLLSIAAAAKLFRFTNTHRHLMIHPCMCGCNNWDGRLLDGNLTHSLGSLCWVVCSQIQSWKSVWWLCCSSALAQRVSQYISDCCCVVVVLFKFILSGRQPQQCGNVIPIAQSKNQEKKNTFMTRLWRHTDKYL